MADRDDIELEDEVLEEASLSAGDRRRAYVATLQRDLNNHLRRLGAGTLLAVDGEWDEATQSAFEQVSRILGIAPERNVRTFRIIGGAAAVRTEVDEPEPAGVVMPVPTDDSVAERALARVRGRREFAREKLETSARELARADERR